MPAPGAAGLAGGAGPGIPSSWLLPGSRPLPPWSRPAARPPLASPRRGPSCPTRDAGVTRSLREVHRLWDEAGTALGLPPCRPPLSHIWAGQDTAVKASHARLRSGLCWLQEAGAPGLRLPATPTRLPDPRHPAHCPEGQAQQALGRTRVSGAVVGPRADGAPNTSQGGGDRQGQRRASWGQWRGGGPAALTSTPPRRRQTREGSRS